MRLNFLMLADYAGLLSDQKFLIAGEFDRLYAVTAPVFHPQMYVVGRIDSDLRDTKPHNITLAVLDDQGRLVKEHPIGNGVTFAPTPFPDTSRVQFVIRVDGLQVPAFGAYTFSVLVDNQAIGSTKFLVEKATPEQAAARGVPVKGAIPTH
jgi:hypothetical protein